MTGEGKPIEHTGDSTHRVQAPASLEVPFDRDTAKQMEQQLNAWIHPFSRLHRIPVFKRVWLYLALMAVYTTVVHLIVQGTVSPKLFKDAVALTNTSLVLSLLLVFRTNSAYERWWEGRKLWGQLVNDSRNLCIKVKFLSKVSEEDKAEMSEYIVSFAYALKNHLRGQTSGKRLPGTKAQADRSAHLPVEITEAILGTGQRWYNTGKIDGFQLLQLDAHMRAFMDICGACERILTSPLALSYRAFIRQGIAINLAGLPWYCSAMLPLEWTMPIIMFSSYFLIGLEMIAEDIEEPFGYDGDDLPLDTICDKIRIVIGQIMQDKDFVSKHERLKYTVSAAQVQTVDPLKEHK